MVTSSRRDSSRARRAFVWIAVVAVLLATLLTGAWFFLADRLDREVRNAIRTAGERGLSIACDNQEVFGYPFRLGVRCDTVAVDAPAARFRASAGALRTAGQIYDPTRIVAELDAPLLVASPNGPPLDIRWTLGQASAHLWTAGLDRLSLVVDNPEVRIAGADAGPSGARAASAAPSAAGQGPAVRSARLEAHVRRRGDSLDFAFSDKAIDLLQPALEAVPDFDVDADLTVEGAAEWLSGRLRGQTLGQALAGKSGTLRMLRIGLAAPAAGVPANGQPAAGAASAEVTGPFSIAADGEVSGAFDLALSQPDAIADLVGTLVPEVSGITGTIASSIGFAGKTENGRTVIQVTVTDGEAALGFIPLGRIPPIR